VEISPNSGTGLSLGGDKKELVARCVTKVLNEDTCLDRWVGGVIHYQVTV
jgi:hypothetical protein